MINFQKKDAYTMEDLVQIMAILRQPDGCPWDREQTHQSIRRNMLEEAYEAAEAIDQNDPEHLKEELGDVLFQVIFHSRLEEEAGRFDLNDVVDGICKKLVFRHPHVFGSRDANDADQALVNWEAQKRIEKDQKTAADTLDAVARSLPALIRAEKIQNKARKAGFDWSEIGPVLDKLSEELDELKQAVREQSNTEEELGDLLFATVKAGWFLGIDSELALHNACEKFIRRFRTTEELAGGVPMTQLPISQLEELWTQAKSAEQIS